MTETTLDEQIAAMNAKADAYLATLPPELAARIRPLKVSVSLTTALRSMEEAVYRALFDMANARARAFLSAALAYGDLAPSDYDALDAYRHDMNEARRDLLT